MSTISSLGIGSGLDLNGLLDQLNAAERGKLAPIQQQRANTQAKISAFGRLEGGLSQLQSSLSALKEGATFDSVKSTVTGSSVKAAAAENAAPGAYSVNVTQLARAYSVATAGVVDKEADLGAADISIVLDNGDTLDVSLTAGASSLEDLRDAINAEQGGVTASIVNDGSGTPYRLALTSSTTGTESAIASVDFGALGGTLALDAATEVTARNASLTVNGIGISSQTNQVEDAIQGVTLSLSEEGESTVDVSYDRDAVKEAITGFVTAYNKLKDTTAALTSFNSETGQAGQLLGNSTMRGIESRLRGVISGAAGGEGEMQMLSQLGISLELDGKLSIDDERLDEIVDTNPQALSEFFGGDGVTEGFATRLSSVVDGMIGDQGSIKNVTDGLKTTISSLEQRFASMERSIESTISRYRDQFGRMDSMIASMNSTASYLTQQFDMMNAQLGRRK